MRRVRGCREQLNNKGVSLVEIIVAIMILAIVTIPVLRTLVLTANFNARAKEEQTAIASAEGVMEVFKGYDLEKLCRQFDSGATAIFPSATTSVTGYDSGGNPVSVLNGSEFVRSHEEKYTFRIAGLTTETGQYDAKIEVKGKEIPNPPEAGSPNVLGLIPQNEYTDAICMGAYDWDSKATPTVLQYVCDTINADPHALKKDYVPDDLDPNEITYGQRVVQIYLKQTGDVVKASYKVYYYCGFSFHYQVAGGGNSEVFASLDHGGYFCYIPLNEAGDTEVVFYDNTETVGQNAKLENLYFYYYPCYKMDGGPVSDFKDVIQIHSDLNYDVGLHVFKQKSPLYSDVELQVKETAYHLVVDYIEENGEVTKHPVIYHNLKDNLSGSAGLVLDPFFANGSVPHPSYEEEFVVEKPLLYTVDVEIYEHGDATETRLAHFSSTMNE